MTDEEINVFEDIKMIETSKMFISEKKYYIKLIDTLKSIGYYKVKSSLKELWSK